MKFSKIAITSAVSMVLVVLSLAAAMTPLQAHGVSKMLPKGQHVAAAGKNRNPYIPQVPSNIGYEYQYLIRLHALNDRCDYGINEELFFATIKGIEADNGYTLAQVRDAWTVIPKRAVREMDSVGAMKCTNVLLGVMHYSKDGIFDFM